MRIQSVFDSAFTPYGRLVEGIDAKTIIDTLLKTALPDEGIVYVPSDAALEGLAEAESLSLRIYGGMPIQIGYCNGRNNQLNCLEYHRNSEIDITADDIILILAPLQRLKEGRLHTSETEAFLVPAGTAVQLYETTLHYAPCGLDGGSFRTAVVLPQGTNTKKPDITVKTAEDRLLWARNKWLIAHPQSVEAAMGAFAGLEGENIRI